jgi:hypothetical protein
MKLYAAAWAEASTTMPPQYGLPVATTSIFSESKPPDAKSCRSISLQVFSWPDHNATEAQLQWASQIAQKYPGFASTDIETLAGPPIATM